MVDGSSVEVIQSDLLKGISHGFLGRVGGVSRGVVAGLNVGLGSDDDPEAIAENRRRAAAAIATDATLATVYQVHSADCATLVESWSDDDRPHADALVTKTPGVVLGILTADCAPVLFADHEAGVIGASHAGWKGAIAGVTDTTIAAMESFGAVRKRIVAVVGPCIAQSSYEVDEVFRTRFVDHDAKNATFFIEGAAQHWHFDLEGYVIQRLRQAGIRAVEGLGLDTYSAPDRFFSFRRATHAGEASYGRQISAISLS